MEEARCRALTHSSHYANKTLIYVEMEEARYRALTPLIRANYDSIFFGRNGRSPLQGIDTFIPDDVPSRAIPGRNDRSPLQDIDTFPHLLLKIFFQVEMAEAHYRDFYFKSDNP